jgi:lipoprotein-anchoring transpeptidase ErfK/SrfK
MGFSSIWFRNLRIPHDSTSTKGYYLLQNGGWIPGDGARVGEISTFQGLVFQSTPRNSFGWAFEQIPVLSAPGYNAPQTGQQIMPFQVVQIFDTQNVDNADWNLIGPDQWVEARKVAQVVINTTPPEGVTTGRWIDVNLAEQSLAVYDNDQLVYATVIASGMDPFWTRPGTLQIQTKKETETMRNNDPSDFYYLDTTHLGQCILMVPARYMEPIGAHALGTLNRMGALTFRWATHTGYLIGHTKAIGFIPIEGLIPRRSAA